MKDFSEYEKSLLNTLPSKLDVIAQNERKKLKQRISHAKYRANLTDTTEKKKEYNNYQADYIQKYRSKKKIELLDAISQKNPTVEIKESIVKQKEIIQKKLIVSEVRKTSRITKKTDLSIKSREPIVVVKNKKKIVARWRKELMLEFPNYTPAQLIEAKSISPELMAADIVIIRNVMLFILELKMSKDLERVITKIFRGYDILGDIRIIKNEMPFLADIKLMKFVNQIQDYYPVGSSFKNKLRPFVNLLSRIDSYSSQYQQLSNLSTQENIAYETERKENKISSNDKFKLFNYNPTSNKILIDKLDTDLDKAIASVYLLMPPRRLDFQYMVLTDVQTPEMLTNRKKNYLIMRNNDPIMFVYNNFKTHSKGKKIIFGQQSFSVDVDVAFYLKKYIINNKLNTGNYLFGSQDHTQYNSNFGKKLENVMLLLTNVSGITSKWIRVNAANYINSSNKSVGEIEKYAERMAHNYSQSQQYRKFILEEDDTKEKEIKIERDRQVLKKNKIPIIKIEDIKKDELPIVDENKIRRSNRNRSM